jgi:hypothetical protein
VTEVSGGAEVSGVSVQVSEDRNKKTVISYSLLVTGLSGMKSVFITPWWQNYNIRFSVYSNSK